MVVNKFLYFFDTFLSIFCLFLQPNIEILIIRGGVETFDNFFFF